MSFQGYTGEEGKWEEIMELKGESLIGSKLKAPLSVYGEVYLLPMFKINMEVATGFVTSVPSDAPDDYMALEDLKKKKQLRDKFNLKLE